MRMEQTARVTHLRARRDSNLVLHRDISMFRRRLHNSQADLQRRQPPAAAVQHGFTVHQRPTEPERGCVRSTSRSSSDDWQQDRSLLFTLAVRGGLRPEVQADESGVSFVDGDGVVRNRA